MDNQEKNTNETVTETTEAKKAPAKKKSSGNGPVRIIILVVCLAVFAFSGFKIVSEIIDGATMEVVDSAIPELDKVGPSITNYTAIGLLLGFIISAGFIIVSALMDDTIHNEEFILQHYDIPILAKVPNLLDSGNKRYGYYYKYKYKQNSESGKEGSK
jgi:hypothetical protein